MYILIGIGFLGICIKKLNTRFIKSFYGDGPIVSSPLEVEKMILEVLTHGMYPLQIIEAIKNQYQSIVTLASVLIVLQNMQEEGKIQSRREVIPSKKTGISRIYFSKQAGGSEFAINNHFE